MAGMNRVILLGNLGSDPVLKTTSVTATQVCTFFLATNETYRTQVGESRTDTQWHRIVCWGKLATVCAEHLSKGSPIFLEGKISSRHWKDSEGIQRTTTEVVAMNVQFLARREKAQPAELSVEERENIPS